jgi:type 2 lantibiotic biosynthesis protein LanM
MRSSISRDLLAEIAAAGDAAVACLHAPHRPARSTAPAPASRFKQWCRIVAGDDAERFAKRLQWANLDRESVLHTHHFDDALPQWTDIVRRVIEAAASDNRAQNAAERPLSERELLDIGQQPLPTLASDPLPFEDVWLPAIRAARRLWIESRHNSAPPRLSQAAYWAFERSLLRAIAHLSAASLEAEFAASRPAGYRLTALFSGAVPDAPPADHYKQFVSDLLHDGMASLFARRCVLARLVARLIENWIESLNELLHRLDTDWQLLHERFPAHVGAHGDARDDFVAQATAGLSDRHHGGRSVASFVFASGRSMIYKPRSVALESALQTFLQWCNDTQELPHAFKTLTVVDRGAYGWMERIESAEFTAADGGHNFYHRLGMLLCILRVLRATDCHRDNLFAAGEHPVLIDAEALMHPEVRADVLGRHVPAAVSIDSRFRDSVLRTGMLPRWDFIDDNTTAVDVSAIGGSPALEPERTLRWTAINTDFMHRGYVRDAAVTFTNVPRSDGRVLDPADHVNDLVSGFESAYDLLLRHRDALLAGSGPLAPFRSVAARFVFRPTHIYYRVLEQSLAPAIRTGIDRSITIDVLSRTFLTAPTQPAAWPLARAEAEAIERIDIPYFSAQTTSRNLSGEALEIPDFFEAASFDDVLQQIHQLGPDDLQLQVALIRGALQARAARSSQGERIESIVPAEEPESPPARDFLSHALAIADDLASRALWTKDGSANWIGLSGVANEERYQLEPLGGSLYSGAPGVAIFLAAVDRATGNRAYGELARAALKPLRYAIGQTAAGTMKSWARVIGIGGCTGIASCMYALCRVAGFLDDDEMLRDARRAADLITESAIAEDRTLDVLGGSAGTVLTLVALSHATGDREPLALARRCADHLVDNMVDTSTSHRAWRTIDPVPLTGFSHGAAGIAYALLRLHAVSADERYEAAAKEAIRYEQAVYSEADRNWPDFRGTGVGARPRFMASWCHGAPGIGLGRLGALDVFDSEDVRNDIDAAVDLTRRWGLNDIDHPCCGNAGRAEMLVVAAERLDRPDLLQEAARQMAWVVDRAQKTRGYHLFPNVSEFVFAPGYFQGLAGIGYTLLRLHEQRLPSVLLLT